MDEEWEDRLVLRLTVEHLLANGDWPRLRDLHRVIHQELGQEADVRSVAKRLAPHPFYSGYHDLGDTFAPPLQILSRVGESTPLVDGVLAFVRHARSKYVSSKGETQVSEGELVEALSLDPILAAVIRKLVDGVPWLTQGGGSGERGWYVTVSDDVTRWAGVESREDLLESLEAIELQRRREYAAMAAAKAQLVRGTHPAPATTTAPEEGTGRWYETHLAKGIAWSVGIIGALVGIVVALARL